MDNVLIEYLFAGLFKLWLKTPRFLKYATFALIAVAAALYGFYRLSIFSAAFIPAIYFARNGDKLACFKPVGLLFGPQLLGNHTYCFWSIDSHCQLSLS